MLTLTVYERYLARNLIGSFIILLLVGFGMVVLLDLLFNLDNFTDDGRVPLPVALPAVIDYYLYKLPLYFYQLAPAVLAISAAFTLSNVLRNNELTPLLAAGVPLWRLIVPLSICAGLILPLLVGNRELLLPSVAAKVARKPNDATGVNAQRLRCIRDERGTTLSAEKLDAHKGRLVQPYWIEPATDDGSVGLVHADSAEWDPARREWRLERGERRIVSGDAQKQREVEFPNVLAFPLNPDEIVLRQATEWSDLLSTRQLKRLAANRSLPSHDSIVQSLILRFTEPLSYLVLLALAVPAFLTRERGNVIAAAGRALLWSGAFFAVSYVSRELVSDVKSAQLAAGLPLIVFGPLALLQLMNLKT